MNMETYSCTSQEVLFNEQQKICAAMLTAALSLGFMVGTPPAEAATRAELAQISVNQQGTNFKYWNKDAKSYQALVSYVKDVTNPGSSNFIPVEDRIAVFDLDGTLICETTPSYFEWMMYLERALNDPSFTPKAEDREYAKVVKEAIYKTGIPGDMERKEAKSQASVFAGMTLPEYEAYVKKFMETPAEGMKNLKRGDSSMFNYTITNNKYKALAFSLLCDDTVRELGNQKKADKMRASCEKYGWIPVSMRDDFKTIYGDNVTRAK